MFIAVSIGAVMPYSLEKKRECERLKRLDPAYRALKSAEEKARYAASAEYRAYRKAYSKAYLIAHREEKRIYDASRRATPEGWAVQACHAAKRRARELGILFDIVPEDLLPLPEVCQFTRLPFDFTPKGGKASPQSASLDRIKPDRGYVRGNVRVISYKANTLKNDCTDPAVFQRLADDAHLWGLV
jgi:hypothetical protein